MMKKLRIYPYKMRSSPAKKLAKAMKALRVYPDRGYRPRTSHIVLNWGSSKLPAWYARALNWINHPYGVEAAVNKDKCLDLLQEAGVAVVPFTRDIEVAKQWQAEGYTIVERKLLQSHSGKGIRLVPPSGELGEAKMYTQYVGQRREYRVHVFNGEVIYLQQKKRRNGAAQNDEVRNHSGGWVYAAEGITPLSEEAIADAVKSVEALGLTFGGVDVITRRGKHYILEVNTAPGLGGPRSVEIYKNAISNYINSM